MKKLIINIVFVLSITNVFCQNWQWEKHIGSDYGPYGERSNSLITDGTNYYMIGSYGGILHSADTTLQSNGTNDVFIIKFDQNGNQLWAKTIGGNYSQYLTYEDANGTYDPVNNCIYISGALIGTVDFGGSISQNFSTNNTDVFIARMDLNGNFIWVRKIWSSGNDNAYCFAEPDGDILLAGQLENNGYFNSIPVASGGFFARFDKDGNLKWIAHKFSGPEKYRTNISFIGKDIIMGGYFDLNPSYIDTVILIPHNSIDGYLTRMDSVGNVKWIKSFGSSGTDGIGGVTINDSNNIYIAGGFNDTIDLGGLTLSNNGKDILIAKFNQNGNIIWARQTFAIGNNWGATRIISDNDGNCYVTGCFSGSASFGNYHISTSNPFDVFITRFSNSGNCIGVRNFGTAGGNCLAQDNYANIVCAGDFSNAVNIGDSTFTSYGTQDIYIAKLDAITGVPKNKSLENNQLIIYANPNTGKCNITVPDDFLHETNLILCVYDNMGKLIQKQNLVMEGDKIKLSLDAEATGVYTATLSNGRKVYSGKIVFE